MEWSPQVGAKYYVLKTAGDDVRDDLVIGATASLEIHYLTLVMKKVDEKPEETELRVHWSAMGDGRVLAKAACDLSKHIRFGIIIWVPTSLHFSLHLNVRRPQFSSTFS